MSDFLRVERLNIEKRLTVEHLSFQKSAFTVILGANGAGKSTLLNALAGDKTVYYQNQALNHYSLRQLARVRAVFSQNHQVAFPISVDNLLALGREIYGRTDQDEALYRWILETFELSAFKNRNVQTLSGGEQQRAHLGRVVAQLVERLDAPNLGEKYLLLDEPTNHLDIRHQQLLFKQLHGWVNEGLTAIAVLHDPTVAMNHADQLVLIKNGAVLGTFTPEALFERQILDELYDIKMGCRICGETGRYYFTPEA